MESRLKKCSIPMTGIRSPRETMEHQGKDIDGVIQHVLIRQAKKRLPLGTRYNVRLARHSLYWTTDLTSDDESILLRELTVEPDDE